MRYRLVGTAEEQIEGVLTHSAREFGIEAAERYDRLVLAAMEAVALTPERGGSHAIRRLPGLRVFPLRLARNLVDHDHRVAQPRHLIVYRIGPDGIVEILGIAHERMVLARAARRMRREADR